MKVREDDRVIDECVDVEKFIAIIMWTSGCNGCRISKPHRKCWEQVLAHTLYHYDLTVDAGKSNGTVGQHNDLCIETDGNVEMKYEVASVANINGRPRILLQQQAKQIVEAGRCSREEEM